MKFIFLFLIYFGVDISISDAQEWGFFLPQPPDTDYVKTVPSTWALRPYTAFKYDQFFINGDSKYRAIFQPDIKLGLGLGGTYKFLSLAAGITVYSSDKEHRSQDIDFSTSVYASQHLAEITLQLYNFFTGRFINSSGDEVYSQFRSDIRTFNAGLNYNYNFNHKQISFNAPFVGSAIQKRSAGTVLVGAYFMYFDLRSNESIIPPGAQPYFNTEAQISEANLLTVGITGGYAYTFVLPDHLFMTFSITPKIGLNAGEIKTSGYNNIPFSVLPGFLTRDAIGYNWKKMYCLFSVYGDYNIVRLGSGNNFIYDPAKVRLMYGLRFD